MMVVQMRKKITQKKLRGIPRRMRALRTQLSNLSKEFPIDQNFSLSHGHWNFKIPVSWALVEGRYTTPKIQKECAQLLINTCASLIEIKPEWAKMHRVTCCICKPNMFSSEICIYLDEEYYQSKVEPTSNEYGYQTVMVNQSLASEWEILKPKGVSEIGINWCYNTSEDIYDHYVSEHWIYGEVT
jgi:hypothetical protein